MPLPPLPEPPLRASLADAAYTRLREWILEGTLVPGEALRDEELAERLRMSRTPIREAMQRLEADGLAVTTASRRTFVSDVSPQDARHVYPVALALESLALRLALPALDAAALDAMRAANVELRAALAAGHSARATAADEALHGVFVARCGNPLLAELVGDLKARIRRIERLFWGTADRSPSLRDHEDLIEALAAADLASAQQVLARNWSRCESWIVESAQTTAEAG